MKLQNGCYYKRPDDSIVKVQIEGDGQFHVYTAEGNAVGLVDPKKHVEGWEPAGESEFNRQASKIAAAAAAKKEKKKKKKAD